VYFPDVMSGLPETTMPNRIRLAFILDSIQDWSLGGTERQLVTMVAQLNRTIFEPRIFVLQPSAAATAKDVGCPVVIVKSAARSRLSLLGNLRRVLKEFRPHVVQTFFIDGIFYGVTAAWLNRVPVIVESRRNAGHWQKGYHSVALRMLNVLVDRWQSNSKFVASKLETEEGIPAERISVLRNYVDLGRFVLASTDARRDARQRLNLPMDAPVFVAVSTLRPVKGLPTFIEAANCLKTKLPGAVFLIVGEGPQREELTEQIRQLGLERTVRLEGAQEDVRRWLAAADVAVLASHSESSSNALMEYMAMGLATVVSDIPANRELVSGEFFAAGQAQHLADKLFLLSGNECARRELGLRNFQASREFGGSTYAETVRKYYFELAMPHWNAARHKARVSSSWTKKTEVL
jgi:glycosyltransferase involved in cell wall biosynthesis